METRSLGERIGAFLRSGDVIAFSGPLAAGKTTLTKGIARGLEITEDVTSPTYTIISEYQGRLPFYHIDAYRLSGEDDFIALGAEELMYGDGVCAIEWSERVPGALPASSIRISLEVLDDNSRRIRIEGSRLEQELA